MSECSDWMAALCGYFGSVEGLSESRGTVAVLPRGTEAVSRVACVICSCGSTYTAIEMSEIGATEWHGDCSDPVPSMPLHTTILAIRRCGRSHQCSVPYQATYGRRGGGEVAEGCDIDDEMMQYSRCYSAPDASAKGFLDLMHEGEY